MYLFITTGTYSFLKDLKQKHEKENLLIMENTEQTLLVQETTKKKTVFATPRRFETMESKGTLEEQGYAVIEYIPVTEMEAPVFEHRLKKEAETIANKEGFTALRALRPIKSDTYALLTLWKTEHAASTWKSQSNAVPKEETFNKKIFSGPPHSALYRVGPRKEQSGS